MTRAKRSRKVNTNGPARPPREKKQANVKFSKKAGKGQATGSRHSGAEVRAAVTGANVEKKDPRHGSKKPIALVMDAAQASVVKPAMKPEQELAKLEQSPRLSQLLDQVEGGELLSQADQFWLDSTLARIAVLMDQLGISDDLPAEEPAAPVKSSTTDSELDLFEQFEQGSDLLDQFKD
ncbi:Der GTPase-activating protein YihI [Ferrimonas lipolytica]|uniref:Der GTPase-activating protein YihI n=1 Tax=Ferrimonas lipolytica TaxID=2724191 RepID=A0A6H1UI22_9GAMM|nr:Der GTPase-activating protein YihI [Ferrimonas lipolytica]QIZ78279.1 GTPase-activating protein [Ferrimonas lipolytica]